MPDSVAIVVDTNLLLHFKGLEELDFAALMGLESSLISVLLTRQVLSELDKFKYDARERLRKRATRVAGEIARLLEPHGAAAVMRSGVTLKLAPAVRITGVLEQYSLDEKNVDDQIIAAVLTLRQTAPERYVILSNDVSMRLRAGASGLEAASPPSDWRLPDEPDEAAVLRQELDRIKAARPRLSLGFLGGASFLRAQRPLIALAPREPFLAQLRELHRAPDTSRMAAFLLPDVRGEFEGARRRANKYISALNAFFSDWERYYEEAQTHNEWHSRRVLIDLAVVNEGSAVAEDLSVFVACDSDMELSVDDSLPAPLPPEPPPPLAGDGDLDTYLSGLSNARGRSYTTDQFLPQTPQLRAYHAGRLNHSLTRPLPRLVARFLGDVRNFELKWKLNTSSLPTNVTGSVHVEVT